MHRILAAAAWTLLATQAAAQTLPAPLFASPPASDSSNRAATTSWVRSQGYSTSGGAGGNVATTPVLIPGSTVPHTVVQRAAATFNVLDYGAVADGTTDLAPALNAIAAQMPNTSSNEILIPAGNYALKSAVVFNGVAPVIEGQGFTAGPNASGASGTWITISGTGYTPFLFENTNARGAQLRNLAFTEVQPTPATGWTPAAYDYVVRVQNALGQLTVDNVLMSGVTKGIYADNSGRLDIKKLDGQFFQSAVEIDDCLDIGHIGHLHAWPYSTSNPAVIAYQEANENTLILHRVDGIFVDDLFSLGAHAAVYITDNATGTDPGTLTKGYFSNLYADFVTYGVWIDSSAGVTAQFANVTTQNNDQTAPGTTLSGGRGLYVTGNTVGLQIGDWRSNITAGSAIDLEGYAANVHIGSLWANTFGTPGSGTAAVTNVNTGSNAGNGIQIDHSWLQGVSPLYLYAPSNGGQEQPVLMNAAGRDANSPRAYSVQSGAAPSVAAIGSDANIDLAVNGKGTSGVRLQSAGQTVVRVDGLNASTDDMLFRGGSGAMNVIAEGGDADIDIDLGAKGPTGGVRLQSNGSTSLRTDNPNGVADDLLVRPGSGTMSVTAEGADANVNVVVTPKGTGKFDTTVIPTGGTVGRSLSDTLGDNLTGRACGMVLDGTTNDGPALQQCLNDATTGQVVTVQPGLLHLGGPISNPNNAVVQFSGNKYATNGTGSVPIEVAANDTLTATFVLGLVSETALWAKQNTKPEPSPTFRVDGFFNATGTSTSNTVNALATNCNVGVPANATANATDYVWCQNTTLTDNGVGPAQNVAIAANVIRPAGAYPGRSNDWAYYGMMADESGTEYGDPNFAGGQTEELDYQASGLDNSSLRLNGARFVAHMAGQRSQLLPNYPSQVGNILILSTGSYISGGAPGSAVPDFASHLLSMNGEWSMSGLDFTTAQPLASTLQTSADQGGAGVALQFSVANSPLVPVLVGMGVTGTNIPTGDKVASVNNAMGAVILSAASTADVPQGSSITFVSTAPAVQFAAGQSTCYKNAGAGCVAYRTGSGLVYTTPTGISETVDDAGDILTPGTLSAGSVSAGRLSVTSLGTGLLATGSGGTLQSVTIGSGLTYSGGVLQASGSITNAAGVTSFDTRTGDITLAGSDVTGALGYTPYDAANPAGYITAAAAPVQSVDGHTGTITLAGADITGALGYTPYDAANPNGYIAASGAPVQSVAGRTGAITLAVGDVAGAAPIASPALTGAPTAPTQPAGDNTTALATDAFVQATVTALGLPATYAPINNPTFAGATTITAQSDSGLQINGTKPGGSGFARSGTYLLIASTNSTAATRLTVNGSAPSGANCINPAANTALDMFVEVVGIDTTAAGNVTRYRLLDALLYRGATAASTQLVNGASNAAPNGSIGAGSSAAFTAAADTTNGCLALSVTPPNADAWHWAARVRTTEVQ